jgi:osomolarity two-component system response regulator SKN7
MLIFLLDTEKPVKIESVDNNEWTEQSTIPIESILTDLFLPPQQQENTSSVAAAAAQLNGGSLIGSSFKTSEGLTFLALGRLSSNKDEVPTPAPVAIDKGKKKMPASWTSPPRVLLVDDDSVYRDVSGRMLNMVGCSIDLAKDGVEALQKMSIEKYDLILMVSHKKTSRLATY